jgi:hypothetical protein
MQNIIEAVKAHAKENYASSYGWQVVVECYTDSEIREELEDENADTVEKAIAIFTEIADLQTERHQEVTSFIW